MADDSMEISSDRGHNTEEDIDIDIDLTAGQVDEDYILEDASFANDYIPQPSPAPGHDDLMIDDDNSSFKMEDADFLDVDGEQHLDQQSIYPLTSPFGQHDTNTVFQEATHQTHQIDYAYEQQAEVPDHELETHDLLVEPGEALTDAAEGHNLESEENSAVEDEQEPADINTAVYETDKSHDGGSQVSHSRDPIQTKNLDEQTKSPLRLAPSMIPAEASEHSASTSVSPATTATLLKTGEPSSEVVRGSLPSTEVKVLYRNTEYLLFATSESDHPDTYFLSDTSILNKPFTNLFEAIRVIIRDELADEDELCLTVEELGLETEETSSMASDVSLAQILVLRDELLKNDGVEVNALCIVLGTRLNFSSRLSVLTAGAAEGRGLSSFSTLPEGSDRPTDLDEFDDLVEGEHDLQFDSQNVEVPVTDTSKEVQIETNKASANAQIDLKYESTADTADAEPTEAPMRQSPNADRVVDNSKTLSEIVGGEDLDEDGDLIDYSDEEVDQSTMRKSMPPVTAVDTAAYEHYAEQNEELRRRSLSRAEEEPLEEEQAEQIAANFKLDSETKLSEDHSHENEEEYVEEDYQQVGDTTEGLEDFSAINYGEDGDDTETNLENFGEETVLGENLQVNEEFTIDTFGQGDSNEFEADVYDDEGQSLEGHEPREPQIAGVHEELSPNSRSLHSEFDNRNKPNTDDSTATSTATMGADDVLYEDGFDDEEFDELDADDTPTIPSNGIKPNAVAEEEDEIGYEDDEDVEDEGVEPLPNSEDASLPVKGTPAVNGKRSFAQTESDDGLTASKDAKRPRS